jgi:hypothetical protein
MLDVEECGEGGGYRAIGCHAWKGVSFKVVLESERYKERR